MIWFLAESSVAGSPGRNFSYISISLLIIIGILMLKEKLKAYEEQKAFTDESSKVMISNPQKKEIER